ncbi:MAG: hypothetical protein ACKVHE_05935 [Planctomycetales bacterium]
MRGSELSAATSLSLLARVKCNDSDAWQRLVNLYSPLVDYWCRDRACHPPTPSRQFWAVTVDEKYPADVVEEFST